MGVKEEERGLMEWASYDISASCVQLLTFGFGDFSIWDVTSVTIFLGLCEEPHRV